MFTGIIESLGSIESIVEKGTNKTFWIISSLSPQLKIDQSVSHNGVCLTVEALNENAHQVTAIGETLKKTNLGTWQIGTLINLERCMLMNARIDGHLVQGHIDGTAICTHINDMAGSWEYRFEFNPQYAALVIEKGSICLNGTSLTIFDVTRNAFSIAVIPYTYEHTNMRQLIVGSLVNLEFDMIGKYINRMHSLMYPV